MGTTKKARTKRPPTVAWPDREYQRLLAVIRSAPKPETLDDLARVLGSDKRPQIAEMLDHALDQDDVRFVVETKAFRAKPEGGWPEDGRPAVGLSRNWSIQSAETRPVADLLPCPLNPRDVSASSPLVELVESIRVIGVQQPLLCRPSPRGGDLLEVVYGNRRMYAARQAGATLVPVIIRALTDDETAELIALEYVTREELTPLEEAKGIQRLLDTGWRIEEVAERLGRPAGWVARRARLTRLSPAWQQAIACHDHRVSTWPPNLLRAVARLLPEQQDAFLAELDASLWLFQDPPSLRKLEEKLGQCRRILSTTPWDLADAELVVAAGPCTACPKRSSREPWLFDDVVQDVDDTCLDGACFEGKRTAHVQRAAALATQKAGQPVTVLHSHWDAIRDRETGKPLSQESWQFERCKKSDPGAIPAIEVATPDRVIWVHQPDRPAKAGRPVNPETGKAEPRPVEDRRQDLHRKRLALALQLLADRLETHVEEDKLPGLTIVALATAFGTYRRADHFERHKSTLLAELRRPLAQLAADLWTEVRPVLQSRWRPTPPITTSDRVEQQWAEAEEICGLLSLSSADALSQAKRELPEPKSWGAQS